MRPLSPSERRVLLGLTVAPERLCRQDVADPGIGWADLGTVAERHGVAPLVYRGLRALGRIDALPDPAARLRDRCQTLYVQNLARNTRMHAELARVLGPLRRAGIPVILLKGAAITPALYGDIGLRYMRDLDLLVPVEARRAALVILQTLGYHVTPDAPAGLRARARRAGLLTGRATPVGADLAARLYERYHFHYYLERAGQPFPLELHWHIVRPGRGVAIEDFWREARPVHVGQDEAASLRPEDGLLHLALHLAADDYGRLRLARLVDLHMAVTRQRLDWTYLCRTAGRHRAVRAVGVALELARHVLGTGVPIPAGRLLDSLDRTLVTRLAARWAADLGSPMSGRAAIWQTVAWTVLRRDRWPDVPRRLYRALASYPETNARLPERYRGSELMNLLYAWHPRRVVRLARRAWRGRVAPTGVPGPASHAPRSS